ncbi:hypothetical protein Tsubulata_001244, partial [Turnera subulata]
MAPPISPLLLASVLLCLASGLAGAAQYSVVSYGAKPDGKTDSTKAFVAAWAQACASTKPATVYVPKGSFLVGQVRFQGPCKNTAVVVRIAGNLIAPSDYRVLGNTGNWLVFNHVNGVTVSGGTLDGQGAGLWSCKASGKGCPYGATSLEFSNSKNIVINGVASLNSQLFHIVINGCQNVKVQNVKVSASGNSPNTDGIHVQSSTGVTILNSKIGTGDDCVSIGPGTTNLWIENMACGPGHGISLGKDSVEAGVQNVTVTTTTFTGTKNGVRIKSWGRPSTGFARNILFQHAIMNNVQNPIIIDQNYCPDNNNCPGQVSGVKISDVTYLDIHGSSATQVGVKFDCSREYPCTGIKLEDVNLTYKNQPAAASCSNADGTAAGFAQSTAYNVIDFGAKPDGQSDSTQAFESAWRVACNSTAPATLIVPRGKFLVQPLVFSGPCKSTIVFSVDGTILGPSNYTDFGNSGFWILFYKVKGVTLSGGTLDANGAGFWACRKAGKDCPPGARSLSFVGAEDIVVDGLTSMNSQYFHIAIDQCRNIKLLNLRITAPSWSPNTDGVHLQSSTEISISDSIITTGDDCISLGPGSNNVWIQGISCGPGHGISVGSLAEHPNEDGVQNLTVSNVVFTATQNGVRIKSWGRPSTGFARNMLFRDILMKNVYNPIIIDQQYCPGHGCPKKDSGVKISGVTYKNISGTSATLVAMDFLCSSSNPCQGLKLEDIQLTYYNGSNATSFCANANGTTSGIRIPSWI